MYVVSPITNEYFTKGKAYRIIKKSYSGGDILNDSKHQTFIIYKNCAFLDGKDWIIPGIKRELKGRDQYNKLNRKEKNRFKKLYIQAFGLNQWHQYLNQVCRCFSSFITNGFEWFGTPQGIDYWVKLSSKFE